MLQGGTSPRRVRVRSLRSACGTSSCSSCFFCCGGLGATRGQPTRSRRRGVVPAFRSLPHYRSGLLGLSKQVVGVGSREIDGQVRIHGSKGGFRIWVNGALATFLLVGPARVPGLAGDSPVGRIGSGLRVGFLRLPNRSNQDSHCCWVARNGPHRCRERPSTELPDPQSDVVPAQPRAARVEESG